MRARLASFAAPLLVACALSSPGAARADAPPPRAVELPAVLSLDDALRLARERGLAPLLAQAAVAAREGEVQSSRAIANPSISAAAGPLFNYSARPPCSGCQQYALEWGLSDNAAVSDLLTGKRRLRMAFADTQLAAAKLEKIDALRTTLGAVKAQYIQIALAKRSLAFVRHVGETLDATVALSRQRYPGVIDEGELARVEIQKLQADQAIDMASLALRTSKIGLAQLLGVRGAAIPEFDVDGAALDYRVPAALAGATEQALLDRSFRERPDLKAAALHRDRARAGLRIAERERFPSIELTAQYSQAGTGQDAAQPMGLVFGVEVPLPVFYQQQGEIRRAHADVDAQSVEEAKLVSSVVAEVRSAWASFAASRELVERMESTLLDRAKTARDIVDLQYKAGATTLMDFLDAERTFIATNLDYLQHLAEYWTAVFLLEQAVGTELR